MADPGDLSSIHALWFMARRDMTLQDAFDLFRRLGVHPDMLSRSEFSAA
jgi:hypothetical protein